MLMLGTGAHLGDNYPGRVSTTNFSRPPFGVPGHCLLSVYGIHSLGVECVVNLVAVREYIGQRFFQAFLYASPRHAIAPKSLDELSIRAKGLDSRLFVRAQCILGFVGFSSITMRCSPSHSITS